MHSCNKPVREPRSTLPVRGEPLPILWTELDVPAPCRHPDRALVSMEAAGLMVSEACETAGLPYYHGPGTISYTSCILL